MQRKIKHWNITYKLDIPIENNISIINNTAYIVSGKSIKKISIPKQVTNYLLIKGIFPVVEITNYKENLLIKNPINKPLLEENILFKDSISSNRMTIPENIFNSIRTNSVLYVINPRINKRVCVFGLDIIKKPNGIESKLIKTIRVSNNKYN